MRQAWWTWAAAAILAFGGDRRSESFGAEEPARPEQAVWLRHLDGRVVPIQGGPVEEPAGMLARDARSRLRAANLRENRAWEAVTSLEEWEAFRAMRLGALRESLGPPRAEPTAPPRVIVAQSLQGDGYRVENLAFESRPGLVVTANLYIPARPGTSMPGLLISHSHHNPRTQGELQDMGMTWARQGCLVLIMDHLGHGERRQHPFTSAADHPRPFKVGRQDYYFRYNTGIQLELIGESLMGWMVWDLRRGVDLLLSRPGIDKDRIILLGAVAGGGDPAAVTAALDPRVKAVVPFNFGGPQPDFAVPADASRDFYYFGVADWESTRCLRLGARDGFAQWLIIGSVAPRGLVYAHEFAWDRDRDPIWPRLLTVYKLYDAADRLTSATGRGTLKGSPPESSHCNNIGPIHRGQIYPTLERWFGMPAPEEYSHRREQGELLCLTPEVDREFRPRPLHTLAAELGAGRAAAARLAATGLSGDRRKQQLRNDWAKLLGDIEPGGDPRVLEHHVQESETVTVERILLGGEPGMVVPVMLLRPHVKPGARVPVVVGLAQEGKQAFLEQRSEALAGLLSGGAAVCLVDLRGTGETRPRDGSRRHTGAMTSLSATEWLLGQTLVGSRLRDLRSVLRHLRLRPDLDAGRLALWGDSFAPTNPEDRDPAVPLDVDPSPHHAEPLGGLMSLLGALFEDGIRAVSVRGGLTGYESLLQSPYFYVPHDALVPGALTAGDLCDVAASLAPRPLRMEGLVDGLNRRASDAELTRALAPTRAAYRAVNAGPRLELGDGGAPSLPADRWFLRELLAE
jgi:dienelactone hydrolase